MISYDFITKSTWNHWALDGVLPALSCTYQYNGILCSLAVLSAFPLTPSSCYAASACLSRRVSHSHLYDMAKARHDGVDGKEQTRDIPKLDLFSQILKNWKIPIFCDLPKPSVQAVQPRTLRHQAPRGHGQGAEKLIKWAVSRAVSVARAWPILA